MLLRRFLTHFNRQDWLAIFLDFVIVVVGIFVGLQASLEAEASQVDYFRDRNIPGEAFVRRHFPVVANPDRSGTTIAFDFEALSADPTTFSVLANQQRNHRMFKSFRQDIADQFGAARAHIATLIDIKEPLAAGNQ